MRSGRASHIPRARAGRPGRLFFHPEISIWLGVGLNVGPGSAGLGPYCAQKIGKRGKEDLFVGLELF